MSLFVTFEGPDGSGKSTQLRLLADALRSEGHSVRETREPGGTPLGERVREILLHPEGPPIAHLTEALLLSASRTQLLDEVILPALARGEIVLADRYADSTIAYQAYGWGLDEQVIRDLQAIATSGIVPHLSVFVDIEPEVGLARTAARGPRNRLDRQDLAFHRRVREGYLQIIARDPARWLVVDGNATPENIHHTILQGVHRLLKEVTSAA